MALPPYAGRIKDAVGAVADIDRAGLDSLLGKVTVTVTMTDRVADPAWRAGAELLVNLLARFYPRLSVRCADAAASSELNELARAINPDIENPSSLGGLDERVVAIGFGTSGEDYDVIVDASGWIASIDEELQGEPPAALTTMVAACLASAEAFRIVFSDNLAGRGRQSPQPGRLTLSHAAVTREVVADTALPVIHLAGAGAIGQSFILAMSALGLSGALVVVDPEGIELSNLQRYTLTTMADIGVLKVDLAATHLEASGWTATRVATPWGADARSGPGQDCVVVALDSVRDRISVAAGIHRRIFNAWTQPEDLGTSRHEAFGTEPCLSCLYYPDQRRPSDHELVAAALVEHPLRVLAYFTTNVPVGAPLPFLNDIAGMPLPEGADRWLVTPLVADLLERGLLPSEDLSRWATKRIGELYSEGVCGGGLLPAPGGKTDTSVMVPLAHQSALAGVLLAFEVVAAYVPELAAARSPQIETRLNLLVGLPQITARPRERTVGCICSDSDFLSVARTTGAT